MSRRNRRKNNDTVRVVILSILILSLLLLLLVVVMAVSGKQNESEPSDGSNPYITGIPLEDEDDVLPSQNVVDGTVASASMPSGETGTEESGTPSESTESTPPPITDPEILWEMKDWGLGFGKPGEKPSGVASIDVMKQYNAYFVSSSDEKVLYLTFDCGYENGNTAAILDVLKKHNAPATFFVVGHYLNTAPDLVKRMVEEGHTVGNHTFNHPDMSTISDVAAFQKEMNDTSNLFKEITGTDMAPYYRPPQGKYCLANLQMAKDMGYSTFFWSIAHVDWDVNNQPTHEKAMTTLMNRTHPGAIVLLHVISKTNGEILDDLLTEWEEMGYTFRPLSDFTE